MRGGDIDMRGGDIDMRGGDIDMRGGDIDMREVEILILVNDDCLMKIPTRIGGAWHKPCEALN
jgi:hypothetical protein